MFRLITTMRRGSSSAMPQAYARYASLETARAGAADLLKEERVLRVMIVHNDMPRNFIEWMER